jgi:hypothetical protein
MPRLGGANLLGDVLPIKKYPAIPEAYVDIFEVLGYLPFRVVGRNAKAGQAEGHGPVKGAGVQVIHAHHLGKHLGHCALAGP